MNTTGLRIPVSTYRLQFNADFRFSNACEIVTYLQQLGISDIYASPYFKARTGSRHGYDILDQNMLNPEIGTEEEYDQLVSELQKAHMGHILDIVPNHMSIEGPNSFWMDVLENGPSSPYASFFDIDWHPVKKELDNKVLLPILSDQYGTVLENGELGLVFEEGSFYVEYYDHRLPIIPKSYSAILAHDLAELEKILSRETPQFQELMSIITALKHLPSVTERIPERITERYREKEVVKRRLWSLYQNSNAIRSFIDVNVATFNGTKGDSHSFDLLDALLHDQVYRISHWRVATEEINYRRFFDINSLGAIRVEIPDIFEKTHQLIFKLVETGKITGLRIDHVDGLQDPEDYIRCLQSGCFIRLFGNGDGTGSEGDNTTSLVEKYGHVVEEAPSDKPFYIVGEKILLKGEKLPDSWQLFSTTGYDYVNQLNNLFVDSANRKLFDAIFNRFLQQRLEFADAAYDKKKLVMQVAMSSEVNTLGHYLNKISEQNRHTRDFTLNSLIKSIVEVIACFPVYRTYINSFEVLERDRQYVELSIARAKRRNPATSTSVFDFIRDVLLLHFPADYGAEQKESWLDFVKRFQQITGPVMAKGVEDTAFYLYNRLVSLNEVGGDPERFGLTLEAFHGQNIERSKHRPLAMLATSTHDTKRSEDVRARINVLSEIPELWREGLIRWIHHNRKAKMIVDGIPSPSRNEEYLLYQTLVGAWPLGNPDDDEFDQFRSRIKQYMLKAMREAKEHTSWISPDSMHEDAVMYFIDTILKESRHNYFLQDFAEFQRLTAACGKFNSLSQTLLKITSPGIPDFYQGSEVWDFSLVDPDNRRPVNYLARMEQLEQLERSIASKGLLETAREILATSNDGRIKLYLTSRALRFRRERRELFDEGNYLPLNVEGVRQKHVCAFDRSIHESAVLVVVPLFCRHLIGNSSGIPLGQDVWQDTRVLLPHVPETACYRNILTGEMLALEQQDGYPALLLGDILAEFPVALLERLDRNST